ncbi:kunitz/Bovine pancreatic trypsin inhibitor domain-containing protein [Ditylenchus destructor]|uniref:Kunitz/Bovine pancreatic trypsin inhibitor domain-containing protein n=1 Tax=Ditylenchus destructor TaxID=166010 RepID=A0AAD4MUM4_9BILA|nr:kunitz/Bovine pancreatic trypsin inhibitor domain-containing protein [Ditylenchus destructor]
MVVLISSSTSLWSIFTRPSTLILFLMSLGAMLVAMTLMLSGNSTSQKSIRIVKSSDRVPEYSAYKDILSKRHLCKLPLAKGNCTKKHTRFYYDTENDHCHKFFYTGCKGNGNRFLTKHQCKQRCSPNFHKHKMTKMSAVFIEGNSSISQKSEPSVCVPEECQQLTNGKCVNDKCRCPKGFEMRKGKCVDTNECHWVDCGRNAQCFNLVGSFRCECRPGFAGSGFNCTNHPDVCLQPFDHRYERLCDEGTMLPNKRSAASESAQTLREGMWQLRYYYDITAGQCRQFWYGGCQFGNGQLNFFTDLQTCESLCRDYNPKRESEEEQIAEVCLDEFDESRRLPCQSHLNTNSSAQPTFYHQTGRWQQRFYFDNSTQKCRLFWFDSHCQLQPANHPRRHATKRSRNVFVHLSTCKRACEMPAASKRLDGQGKKKTIGVIQAIFVNKPVIAANRDKYNIVGINGSSTSASTSKQKVQSEKVKPPLPTSRIAANVKEIAPGYHAEPGKYISEECLDRFDHHLKRACSRGRYPWSPRYYYDARVMRCRMYWSDGACRSLSRNNFPDLATCKWKCQAPVQYIQAEYQKRPSCVDQFDPSYKDDCMGGRFSVRYYFDHERKQCQIFHYGGCPSAFSSRNIFTRYEECIELCETPTKSMSSNLFLVTICIPQSPSPQLAMEKHAPNPSIQSIVVLVSTTTYSRSTTTTITRLNHVECFGMATASTLRMKIFSLHFNHVNGFAKSGKRRRFQLIALSVSTTTTAKRAIKEGNGGENGTSIITPVNVDNFALLSPPATPETLRLSASSTSTEEDDIGTQTYAIQKCLKPKQIGNCDNELPAFFYNKQNRHCEPFSYSGCGGNSNRFLTLSQCEQGCAKKLMYLTSEETNCFQSLNVGFGRLNMSCVKSAGFRFYYNPEYGKCSRFWYFGCGGNDNRFLNYESCERLCQGRNIAKDEKIVHTRSARFPSISACFTSNISSNSCTSDDSLRDNSTMVSASVRWMYSPMGGTCKSIETTECSDEMNKSSSMLTKYFESQSQCEQTCSRLKPPRSSECAYLPDWGECNHLRYVWFYNLSSGGCEQFLWGGCGGNPNRFATFELCQITCEMATDDLCLDKLDRGQWCKSMSNRYYFDADSNSCKGFHYTGCGQSRNNFRSLKECEQRCILHRFNQTLISEESKALTDNKTTGELAYTRPKPPEMRPVQRHEYLSEAPQSIVFANEKGGPYQSYMKAEGQWLDYGQCTGFRYNISGTFTRLTSYMCLMEEGGTCQIHTLWDTSGDEHCRVVRPWLSGTHYYAWFFIVDRRPYWRRPDGPPQRKWSPAPPEPVTPPPIQLPEQTISTIIVLPVNDCHSIC